MTQKEQTRLQVLNSVLADQVPVCQAAEVLGVSERHMRRILAAYRKEGAAALAHGNRCRRPANTTTETKMTYVVQLARTRYAGTNHTHLTELLMEREGIDLSRSTVRRILVSAGVDSPRRRRPPRHRVRRKRMAQEGMLLQIDGSHHRWLGEQGPRFVLLLAVDDASGTVPDALFSQEEDTRGYFLLMEGLSGNAGYRWPSTATDTRSSSILESLARSRPGQPSSPAPWRSWGYARYSPGHRRRRAGSSGRRGHSRTGW